MVSALITVFAFTAQFVLADVLFTSPARGSTVDALTPVQITWVESGRAPAISQLANYALNLCAGSNVQGDFICSLATIETDGSFIDGNTITGRVPANVGEPLANA
ncbi:hypothetical protein MRB53_039443 [Persea americana]|nr:hypothetical protein MRB53_039443 [Persea americana]